MPPSTVNQPATPGETLAEYIATSLSRSLPAAVVERARIHLLDTVAAIVSGRCLPAGRLGVAFARQLGGPPEATLLGSSRQVSVLQAAILLWGRQHDRREFVDDSFGPFCRSAG